MEHPFAGSWGYQVIGFFAPTSRFGTPDDFRYFVDECHRHGIGVILDWVPGHFPEGSPWARGVRRHRAVRARRSAEGRAPGLGNADLQLRPERGPDVPASNALFWLEEFHIDGLRVDAVASMLYLDYSREAGQWIPNQFGGRENLEAVEFLKQLNTLTHGARRRARSPSRRNRRRGRRSAGRSTSAALASATSGTWAGCTTCSSTSSEDPVHRRWHHNQITFSMLYAFTENFVLPFSHDEVVHGKRSMLDKMPGDLWQKHATLRALYGYMFAHPGQEADVHGRASSASGASGTTTPASTGTCCSTREHAGTAPLGAGSESHSISASRRCTRSTSITAGFSWIDCRDNENSVMSLVRRAREPAGLHGHRRQLHAGAAAGLPDRRARRRLVPRAAQQRQRDATAEATWGTAAACTPSRGRCTGSIIRCR